MIKFGLGYTEADNIAQDNELFNLGRMGPSHDYVSPPLPNTCCHN